MLVQHYFYNKGVDGDRDALDNTNAYRFGGFEGSAKYRLLSPSRIPLASQYDWRVGYLLHDEVDGLDQHERYIKPEIDFQKDFLEDRLICALDFGAEWAWGKQPAEQYPRDSLSKAQLVWLIALLQTGMRAWKFIPDGNIRFSIL